MNIVLMGMKYTGKSTVGRAFADSRQMLFRDSDEVMQDLHRLRSGQSKTTRDIFADCGEDYFNALEVDAVADIAGQAASADQSMVVSLGGRCPLNKPAVEKFTAIGPVIYLRNSVEVLLERLAAAPLPAFLPAEDAAGQFRDIYNTRKGVFERLADCVVDLDGADVATCVERLSKAFDQLLSERNS